MAITQRVGSETISNFNGLRTDTPASKVSGGYSPDCADMIFSASGMETRHPFRKVQGFNAAVVWYKDFTCKDGSLQTLVLTADGNLYAVGDRLTLLDTVVPGCTVSSWTAYGREYMAFVKNGVGVDTPRQWDGKNLSRVTRGGPGAAPTATNYAIPPTQLVTGTTGAGIAVSTITPTDPQTVQVGGGRNTDDGYPYGGYSPPTYQTFYSTFTVVTAVPHGLSVGNSITVTGNTQWNPLSNVSQVISPTVFKVNTQTTSGAAGNGGTVTPSAPLLQRSGNTVTAFTNTANQLQRGYQVNITGVADQSYAFTTIAVNNETMPGLATITTSSPHGLVPGLFIAILNVQATSIGGGINTYAVSNGTATVVTNTAHGLSVGSQVLVQFSGGALAPWTINSVSNPTTFTFSGITGSPSGSGGLVEIQWPLSSGTVVQVNTVPTANTFTIQIATTDSTWTTGSYTFSWNGTFYVTGVQSATQFTYKQVGPDSILQTGTGTATPQGQIAAGDHLICQHFLTKTGMVTGPSAPFKFTAGGNQYCLVSNLAIGPADTLARYLSFTGANGSAYAILYIPAQVNGLQVSTSTVVNDNTTTSILVDFSDVTLLSSSATRIDVPGNNLFQVTTLNLPRGVRWYNDRMWWIGESNVIPSNPQEGFINLGMDGGTNSGTTSPLGWNQIGIGSVTQYGIMPAYKIAAGQTGEISQNAATTYNGAPILQQNLNYSLRFWQSGVAGALQATISSATTGFSSAVVIPTTANPGYVFGKFSNTMPATIPPDMTLNIKMSGLAAPIYLRDFQPIYADNPSRNPLARVSYIQNPEQFDLQTGNIGPNDDSTELRALFVLQESMHFLTEDALYYTQQIGNAEPSSWTPTQVSKKCGAFHAEAVSVGKGWATWGGKYGFFKYQGGLPDQMSSIINPTWFALQGVTNVYDDQIADKVYIGTVNGDGSLGGMVLDYHELGLGGAAKWCPWNRPIAWVAPVGKDTYFCIAQGVYNLDTVTGIADDDFGNIGGYYTFQSIARSAFFKDFVYLWPRISGQGVMTPFIYKKFQTLFQALIGQELSTLLDEIAEWDTNCSHARQMYVKLGQPGVQFAIEECTMTYQPDPNGEMAGAR